MIKFNPASFGAVRYDRFGSLAALLPYISGMAAFGVKADVKIAEYLEFRWPFRPRAAIRRGAQQVLVRKIPILHMRKTLILSPALPLADFEQRDSIKLDHGEVIKKGDVVGLT